MALNGWTDHITHHVELDTDAACWSMARSPRYSIPTMRMIVICPHAYYRRSVWWVDQSSGTEEGWISHLLLRTYAVRMLSPCLALFLTEPTAKNVPYYSVYSYILVRLDRYTMPCSTPNPIHRHESRVHESTTGKLSTYLKYHANHLGTYYCVSVSTQHLTKTHKPPL